MFRIVRLVPCYPSPANSTQEIGYEWEVRTALLGLLLLQWSVGYTHTTRPGIPIVVTLMPGCETPCLWRGINQGKISRVCKRLYSGRKENVYIWVCDSLPGFQNCRWNVQIYWWMRGNLTSVHCGNGDHRVRGVKGLSPLKPAYLRGTYCKPACMVPLQLRTSADSACASDLVHYPGTPSVGVERVYARGEGDGGGA